MSDTVPDILLKGEDYEDIYLLSGISSTTSVVIQNKTFGGVLIQINSTKPSKNSTDGYLLMPTQSCLIDGTITKIWAKGKCAISVQEVES